MSFLEKSVVRTTDDALPLQLFQSLRDWAHTAKYADVQSPYDDEVYPDLIVDIPMWIRVCIQTEIAESMGCDYRDVEIHTQFFRLTTENTKQAPHGAHNDAIHGKYSAFFYVNEKPEEVMAGTSLVSHKRTGLSSQPKSVEEWACWHEDTNNYDAWNIDEMVFWDPNRLSIYPAERMHRAEPPGGWGKGPSDGRLVLITFFSC